MARDLKAKLSIGKPTSTRRTSEPTGKLLTRANIDVTDNGAPNDRNDSDPQLGRVDVWLANAEGEFVRCNEGTAADLSKGPYVSFCVVDSLQKQALKNSVPTGKVKAMFEAMVWGKPLKSLRLGEPLFPLQSLEQALSEWLLDAYEVDPNTRLIRKRSRSTIANSSSGQPREDSPPEATEHTQGQKGKR